MVSIKASSRFSVSALRRLGKETSRMGVLFLILANCACYSGVEVELKGDKVIMPSQESHPASSTLVQLAQADLAKRLNVLPSEITLTEIREITWRDGSLGCPQPGMRYKQVLVNGSQIRFEVAGKSYYYHSGGGRGPFYCARPITPHKGVGPEPFGDT